MLINSVSADNGVRWLLEGMRLVRRQPLGLPAMVVVYLSMLLLPAIIPLVGIALSGMLGPFATVALMQCVREAAQGRAPSPLQFAQIFQQGAQRVSLVRLGMINAGLLMLVAVLATLVAPHPQGPAPQTIADLPLQPLLVQLLLYAPVMVLMWFAPLLVGWHGASPGKAMFGSAVACWRNLGALAMYGMATLALLVAVSVVLVSVLMTLVSRELLSLFLAPVLLVLMTIVQASFYPMYLSIFGTESAAPSPAELP